MHGRLRPLTAIILPHALQHRTFDHLLSDSITRVGARRPLGNVFDRGFDDLFVAPVAGKFENTDMLPGGLSLRASAALIVTGDRPYLLSLEKSITGGAQEEAGDDQGRPVSLTGTLKKALTKRILYG